MNWTDIANVLGNLGNFIASIGVIVTVVFLAAQIRHSIRVTEEANRLAQVGAQLGNFERVSRWRDRLIRSDEVTDIWLRGGAGASLTANEAERYRQTADDLILARAFSSQMGDAVGYQGLVAANVRLLAFDAQQFPGFRASLERLIRNHPMKSGALHDFLQEVDRVLREPAT